MNKMIFMKSELRRVQQEYKEVVLKGAANLNLNYYSSRQCRLFVDEIKRFWLERKELLRFCWDRITDEVDCFMLSAAIYLQVESNNHYSLKAVGCYQLLPDPFLKMESFLRAPVHLIDQEEIEGQFRNIVKDTLNILETYFDDFFFIDLAVIGGSSQDYYGDTIQEGYINFLKQSLQREDIDSFANEVSTYEEIEKALHPYIKEVLIFNDSNDLDLPLGERIEKFLKFQKKIGKSTIPDSVFDRFYMAVYCLYAQAVDTLLKCLSIGIYPFFRNDVPVKYFLMMTFGYPEDEAIQEFIWKVIVAYFIGKEIEQLEVNNISFDDYKEYLLKEDPYAGAIRSLQLENGQTVTCSIKEVSYTVKPLVKKLQDDLRI